MDRLLVLVSKLNGGFKYLERRTGDRRVNYICCSDRTDL